MGKRAAGKAVPGKKANVAVRGKTSQAKVDATAAVAVQLGDDVNMCLGIIGKVHEALKVINEHSVFKNIMEEGALGLSDGGSQAPFSQSSLTAALRSMAALQGDQ